MNDAAIAAWLRPRMWLGLVAGGLMWLFWFVSLCIGGFTRDAEGQFTGADHIAFYTAATLVREGRAGDMYNFDVVGETQYRTTNGEWKGFTAYRNPPFYALLYVPTAGLSFPLSMAVWMVLSFAALGFAVWCLAPEHPWRVLGWVFSFYPFFASISFGQNTPLSLAAFAAVYRLSAERRPFLAGLVAGLLWYKPQLLLGLFVWWALAPRRHRFEWAGVAVTGGVLAAVSWVTLPEASWAFVDTLRTNVTYGGENGWILHSPRKFWSLLLPTAPAGAIVVLTGLCAVAAVTGAVWVHVRTGGPLAVMFPVAVVLTLWLSPHTLIYEWALLIPAAVVLWDRLPARRTTWLVAFAVAWVAFTVSTAVSQGQLRLLELPFAVQVSIPLLWYVGFRVFRELGRRNPTPDATRT